MHRTKHFHQINEQLQLMEICFKLKYWKQSFSMEWNELHRVKSHYDYLFLLPFVYK